MLVEGRVFLGLAYSALVGLAASTVLSVGIIFDRVTLDPLYQFAIFAVPWAIAVAAIWPRSEDERIMSGAPFGLHPSNRRRALSSCFAPYRPRRYRRWLRTPWRRRILSMELVMGALCLVGHIILPFAFLMAFLVALRRAAWLGNPDAILLEWDWFRLRGPISSPEGHRLAAHLAGRAVTG